MSLCFRLVRLALLLGFADSVALAQNSPLTTVRNSVLSVPTSKLAGSNALVSGITLQTLQGGRAELVGAQEWVRQYSGESFNARNRGQALAVRADGSVVVTGYSSEPLKGDGFVTLAYAADGTPLWTNRYGDDAPFLVATAPSGDVWVAGHSLPDVTNWSVGNAVLLRYDRNGLPLWTNLYTGFGTNSVYATALVVDAAGNAYLKANSSYFPSSGSGWPVEEALIKYDAKGTVAWTQHYFESGPDSGEGPHNFEVLAMDGVGNLYVGGMSGGEHYSSGTSVVKCSADGGGIWTNHQSMGLLSNPRSISPVPDGGVCITSEGWDNSEMFYTVLKLSTDGTRLWTNSLDGPVYEGGNIPMTVVDPAGNVYLIGGSVGTNCCGGLYQILKIRNDGMPLWTNLHADFGRTNSMLYGSGVDNAGNLYLTAYATAPGKADRDWVTVKISGEGEAIWTNRFEGSAGMDDMPFGLVVDPTGSVYVTGETETRYGSDLTIVKYANRLRYTPPKDFSGSDTITYTMTDTLGNQTTGNLAVFVAAGAFEFDLGRAATRLTGVGFEAQLNGAPANNPVVLQTSADLIHWQPVATNAPVGTTVQFLDSTATGAPQRFYRDLQPQ